MADKPLPGYDFDADRRLKRLANTVINLLSEYLPRAHRDSWQRWPDANSVAKEAIGFLPVGDFLDKLSHDEVLSAIPRIEGMVEILTALLAVQTRFRH